MTHARQPGSGFTLVELLVALAVLALLCAIAWPGYGAVVHRAQRTEARLALLELQHAEERHYLHTFAYTDRIAEAPDAGGLGRAAVTGSGAYELSVTLRNEGQGYRAEAVVRAGGRQARDFACARFAIDETGRRSSQDAQGRDTTDECWR